MIREDNLAVLAATWVAAKAAEAEATDYRRALEDRMRDLIGIADNLDGVETACPDGYTIKVTGRIDRKVDSDKLQDLAVEHGLTQHLAALCRWKPELNMAAWRSADPALTRALAGAITAKPGRPSFSITPTATKD